jgi:hypothetical protein
MQHVASVQQALSPLVSILFRIFTALNCGAILLDSNKRTIHLSKRARDHLGEPFDQERPSPRDGSRL